MLCQKSMLLVQYRFLTDMEGIFLGNHQEVKYISRNFLLQYHYLSKLSWLV